jgi:hypothetical protein
MTVAMMSWLGRLSFRNTASSLSRPDLSRTQMDIRMLRKKRIQDLLLCRVIRMQMEQEGMIVLEKRSRVVDREEVLM